MPYTNRGSQSRDCATCSSTFTPVKSNNLYCSRKCYSTAAYSKVKTVPTAKDCLFCISSFTPKRSDAMFCKLDCGRRYKEAKANAIAWQPKPCLICLELFTPARIFQKHCSRKCSHKAKVLREGKVPAKPSVNTCEACKIEFFSKLGIAQWCGNSCWNRAHPNVRKPKQVEWRANNVERRRKACAEWHIKNLEYVTAKKADYRKANPIKLRALEKKRRAKLNNSPGSFTEVEWLAVKRNQWYLCAHCKQRSELVRDHIVPLARGGCNYIFNIQGLCGTCNSRKSARLDDYIMDISLFDNLREAQGGLRNKDGYQWQK